MEHKKIGIFGAQDQRAIYFEINCIRRIRAGFWFKGERPWFGIMNTDIGFSLELWRFSFAYLKKQV